MICEYKGRSGTINGKESSETSRKLEEHNRLVSSAVYGQCKGGLRDRMRPLSSTQNDHHLTCHHLNRLPLPHIWRRYQSVVSMSMQHEAALHDKVSWIKSLLVMRPQYQKKEAVRWRWAAFTSPWS